MWGFDSGLSWGFGCSWGGVCAFVGRVSGFGWEDFKLSWGGSGLSRGGGFVGIRALVGVFRAFAGRVSTMLSWGGIRGGEAFGLSWRGFRAFAMRAFARKTSGFGGEAFDGGFRALVGRIGLSWEDLGFRGGFRAFVGGFVGRIRAFESIVRI